MLRKTVRLWVVVILAGALSFGMHAKAEAESEIASRTR